MNKKMLLNLVSGVTALALILALLPVSPLWTIGTPDSEEEMIEVVETVETDEVEAYDPELYFSADVDAINMIINQKGLSWTLDDPESWTKVTWGGDGAVPRIVSLDLSNQGMTGMLDVSSLILLEELDCYNNSLTEIKLDGLSDLSDLNCAENELTELNLSGQSGLIYLDCSNNFIADEAEVMLAAEPATFVFGPQKEAPEMEAPEPGAAESPMMDVSAASSRCERAAL